MEIVNIIISTSILINLKKPNDINLSIKMLEEMEKNTKEYTDEISLALSLGYHPTFVEADRFLFKLTTPDDYEIAKLIYNYLRGHEICV